MIPQMVNRFLISDWLFAVLFLSNAAFVATIVLCRCHTEKVSCRIAKAGWKLWKNCQGEIF